MSKSFTVCREEDRVPFKVMSESQRKMVFVKRGILVPTGNRCCKKHLYNDHLSFEALQRITGTEVDVVSLDANAVIELVGDCCRTIQFMKTFDFDDPTSLDD